MTLREKVWDWTLAALRPLLPGAGVAGPKAVEAATGRRHAARGLESWAADRDRNPDSTSLLWLHGASAGELLGAAPVVERLRTGRELDLLVTYTSPSAGEAVPALSPAGASFLPLDTAPDCRRALRAVRPSALVFAKGDLWPNLTRVAEESSVPMGMINATVALDSSRLRPGVRHFLRPGHRRLGRVGAVTDGDASRLRRLGVRDEVLEVTGDAAVDRALSEADGARAPSGDGPDSGGRSGGLPGPARRLAALAPEGRPVWIAGSTWPADEQLLVAALARLRSGDGPAPFLVLVPHEPGPGAEERIRAECRERLGAEPSIWSDDGPPEAGEVGDVLVVNRTGLLARLYAAADLAWVGGGLGDDGLHSVVEPAAAGVPVLFGPRGSRWEARALLDRRAAGRLPEEAGPEALAEFVSELLADGDLRGTMGEAARGFAEENAGAAERGARLVAELLEAGERSPG